MSPGHFPEGSSHEHVHISTAVARLHVNRVADWLDRRVVPAARPNRLGLHDGFLCVPGVDGDTRHFHTGQKRRAKTSYGSSTAS